jgi:hypothetical protein
LLHYRGEDVKKGFVVAVVLMLSAPAAMLGQQRSEPHERRDQIKLLEGVLQRAAGLGAEQVAKKLQMLEPGVTALAGQPRARGFVLEGYGVFFDVEVPALMQSYVSSLLVLQRDAQMGTALEQLRQAIQTLPAGQERMSAEQAFHRLEMQVGPVPQRRGRGPQPEVRATDSADATPVSSVAAAPAPAPPGDPIPANWDPLAEYTRAVQTQLIEVMLNYSHGLNLGPDEWLTVAARDSHGPMPGQIDDSQTIVLRVRGSDLAIYAADRTRLDEIRKKVEVRVF